MTARECSEPEAIGGVAVSPMSFEGALAEALEPEEAQICVFEEANSG